MAERALVAQELGLPRPARVLGYRGLARIDLGDRRGLEDLREAVELATEAGQGGEVTNLHNNLGMALWMFEGPSVAPEVFREGIANAKARGGSVAIDALTTGTLDPLFETGELDSVLEVATEMAPRLETQGRVPAHPGPRHPDPDLRPARPRRVAKAIDWLAATSRETGGLEDVVDGLGSAHSGAPRSGRTRPRSYCSRARGDPGARDQEY